MSQARRARREAAAKPVASQPKSPSVRHSTSAIGVFCVLLLVGLVTVLRLWWVPPTIFVEGDDAALCTGIVRLTGRSGPGIYAQHSPKLPVDPDSELRWASAVPRSPGLAYYRYDTMPGMYLIGQITDGLGSVATRMGWICFGAGTILPLLMSLFLTRRLRLSGWIPFCFCFLMVATSPELWISGSAYINDKIVAATLLFAGLTLLSVTSTTTDSRYRLAAIAVSAILTAFAVSARFDTIAFVPAALAILAADEAQRQRRWWVSVALFAVLALTSVVALWAFLGASFEAALGSGAMRVGTGLTRGKLDVLLSGIGPAQVFLLAVLAVLGLPRMIPSGGWPSFRISLRPGPWLGSVAILFLILPDLVFWYTFPFSSQKYLLIASAMIAGLIACLLPQVLGSGAEIRGGGARAVVFAFPFLIVAASFFVNLGMLRYGMDGPRPLGGQAYFRMARSAGSRDAERVVEEISSGWTPKSPIIVSSGIWIREESFAYECAVRGWTYSVVPTGITIPWEEAMRDPHFRELSNFWETNGLRRERVQLTLSGYTPPGGKAPVILIPPDWDVARFGETQVRRMAQSSIATTTEAP